MAPILEKIPSPQGALATLKSKMPLSNFPKTNQIETCPPVAAHLRHYQDDMGQTSPHPPESQIRTRRSENFSKLSSASTDTAEVTSREKLRKARRRIGLDPAAPLDIEHDRADHSRLWWSQVRIVLREPFSEFWGTLVLVLFGNCAVAQVLLSTGGTSSFGEQGIGQHSLIAAGWGVGNMLGVYVAGDSGAYLNPAVTFTFCLYRALPWRRLPILLLAQVLGAFCASGIVFLAYDATIHKFEGSQARLSVPPAQNATAAIFSTYPPPDTSTGQQFVSETISSTMLLFLKFAFKDKTNMGEKKDERWFPLFLFFLLFGINGMFGWEGGYSMNPARDFGPRLMSYFVGYGKDVWTTSHYYFWIPLIVPFLGGALGGFLYDTFIYTGESPINTPWMGMQRLLDIKSIVRSLRGRGSKERTELPSRERVERLA